MPSFIGLKSLIVQTRRDVKKMVSSTTLVTRLAGDEFGYYAPPASGRCLQPRKTPPDAFYWRSPHSLAAWAFSGDDKQSDPTLPAGLFKVLFELRAAVDLDGSDGEGELLFHVLKEQSCSEARGLPIGPRDIPARDKVPRAELIATIIALKPDLKGVHLDEVAGSCHPVALGLPYGVARLAAALPGLPVLEPLQGPTHCGCRDLEPFSLHQNDELILPPTGILRPEFEDPSFDQGRGQGLADMVRPPAGRFQGGQVVGVEPVLPAVEGLGRDTKMATG